MFINREKKKAEVEIYSVHEDYVDPETQIKINRIDYHREVKQEQEF